MQDSGTNIFKRCHKKKGLLIWRPISIEQCSNRSKILLILFCSFLDCVQRTYVLCMYVGVKENPDKRQPSSQLQENNSYFKTAVAESELVYLLTFWWDSILPSLPSVKCIFLSHPNKLFAKPFFRMGFLNSRRAKGDVPKREKARERKRTGNKSK